MIQRRVPPAVLATTLTAAILLASAAACPYPHPVILYYCDGQLRYYRAMFSPDGEAIAADGCTAQDVMHVDLLAPDGALIRRFADSNHAVWAPDGNALYLVAPSDGQVYRQPRDGSARERLTRATEKSYPTEVSPDGVWIAVNRGEDVVLVAADGARETLLAPGGRGARWSPDGGSIAYIRLQDMDACLVASDGTGARWLATGEPISWTADGSGVVVTRAAPAGDGSQQLWAVPTDGSPPHLILDRTSVGMSSWSMDASELWDPSRTRSVVATEHTTGLALGGIVLLDARGSLLADFRVRESLSEFETAAQASWRPDGAAVVYVKNREILLLDVATGASRVLAPAAGP